MISRLNGSSSTLDKIKIIWSRVDGDSFNSEQTKFVLE